MSWGLKTDDNGDALTDFCERSMKIRAVEVEMPFFGRNQHGVKISFPTTSKKRSNDKLQCQFLVDKYTKPGKFGSNRRTQTLNSVDLLSVWNHDEPGPRIVHIGLDRNLGACAF